MGGDPKHPSNKKKHSRTQVGGSGGLAPNGGVVEWLSVSGGGSALPISAKMTKIGEDTWIWFFGVAYRALSNVWLLGRRRENDAVGRLPGGRIRFEVAIVEPELANREGGRIWGSLYCLCDLGLTSWRGDFEFFWTWDISRFDLEIKLNLCVSIEIPVDWRVASLPLAFKKKYLIFFTIFVWWFFDIPPNEADSWLYN